MDIKQTIVAFNYVFTYEILYKVKKLYFFFYLSTNMHKGSKLASEEQVQILTLDQIGKSSREIANTSLDTVKMLF